MRAPGGPCAAAMCNGYLTHVTKDMQIWVLHAPAENVLYFVVRGGAPAAHSSTFSAQLKPPLLSFVTCNNLSSHPSKVLMS